MISARTRGRSLNPAADRQATVPSTQDLCRPPAPLRLLILTANIPSLGEGIVADGSGFHAVGCEAGPINWYLAANGPVQPAQNFLTSDYRPSDPACSASATCSSVDTKLSGLSEIESIPCSTRKAAKSG